MVVGWRDRQQEHQPTHAIEAFLRESHLQSGNDGKETAHDASGRASDESSAARGDRGGFGARGLGAGRAGGTSLGRAGRDRVGAARRRGRAARGGWGRFGRSGGAGAASGALTHSLGRADCRQSSLGAAALEHAVLSFTLDGGSLRSRALASEIGQAAADLGGGGRQA